MDPSVPDSGKLEARAALSLESLLCARRQDKVTDPRDKVYCLLGLVASGGNRILPDCNLSVAKVFTNTAMELAYQGNKNETVQSLRFLSWVQETKPDHGLLSWVPDWSVSCGIVPISTQEPTWPLDASRGAAVQASFAFQGPESPLSAKMSARDVQLMAIKELGSVFTEIRKQGGLHAIENARMLDQLPGRYPRSVSTTRPLTVLP